MTVSQLELRLTIPTANPLHLLRDGLAAIERGDMDAMDVRRLARLLREDVASEIEDRMEAVAREH